MVEKFQCPGCLKGSDTHCGSYESNEYQCIGHVLGTHFGLGNLVALGLPKGFNRPGADLLTQKAHNSMNIRLFPKKASKRPYWDHLNIPVWILYEDGFTFIRTLSPRVNISYVDIVEGKVNDKWISKAIKVEDFIDEID